jgi:hypothetical protein|tara:strand:- start:10803 stop:11534 length:732 start_codon:yes stop_codon:yes gene_type:complete
MIKLDKLICYYINLDIDHTRNDHCIKLLYDMSFDEINRVVPINKMSSEIGDDEKKCTRCRHCKGYGKPRGFKSLTMTTQKIFKEILDRDDDTFYFIFEDDIELTSNIERKDFTKILRNDFLNINDNVDFVYIGLIIPNTEVHDKIKPFDPNNANGYATHAYAINKKGIKELLRRIPCWHQPIDGMYRHFIRAPLLGFDNCAKYGPGHRGYIYQDREAEWYDGTRIVTRDDVSEKLEYENDIIK